MPRSRREKKKHGLSVRSVLVVFPIESSHASRFDGVSFRRTWSRNSFPQILGTSMSDTTRISNFFALSDAK